ncbi:MAG TPA: SPFH domain-containing protein [Chthoniobacterales bacterium]
MLLTAVFLVFLLTVLWPWIFVTIDSGHRGVYYSLFFGGTDVKHELREGFHLKLPWDKVFDYDVRIQQAVYKYSVISSDGLVVQFRTSIRYHPQVRYLGYLQREIGPDYVQTIVIPQTQTALRQVVGGTPIDQIYSTNVTFLQSAVVKAVGEVGLKYILIDDILITEIDIPEVIRKAIEAKLTQQQNSLQYDYVLSVAKKESERKRIEAEGVRDFQRIVTPGISPNFLRWRGIEATLDLAKSANAKVVVIGAQSGLPLILDTASALPGGSVLPVPPEGTPSASPIPEPPVPKAAPSTDLRPPSLVPVPNVTPGMSVPDTGNRFP